MQTAALKSCLHYGFYLFCQDLFVALYTLCVCIHIYIYICIYIYIIELIDKMFKKNHKIRLNLLCCKIEIVGNKCVPNCIVACVFVF